MSLSLSGRKRKDTFTWLLQAQGAGPLDPTSPRVICLGDGTATPLALTSTGVFVGGNPVSSAHALANTWFIDGSNGNDSTAAVGRADLPYHTATAAFLAAHAAGVSDASNFVFLTPGSYTLTLTEWSAVVILRATGPGEDLCSLAVNVTGQSNATGTTGYDAPTVSLFLRGITASVTSSGGPGSGDGASPGNSGQINITGGACSSISTPSAVLMYPTQFHTFVGVRFTGPLSSYSMGYLGLSQFTGCDLTIPGAMFGSATSYQDLGGNYSAPVAVAIAAALAAAAPAFVSGTVYPNTGGSYICTANTYFNDPAYRADYSSLQAGDCYDITVQAGMATFGGGSIDYLAPSSMVFRRTYDGAVWGFNQAQNIKVVTVTTSTLVLTQAHNGKTLNFTVNCTVTTPSSTVTLHPFRCDMILTGICTSLQVQPGTGDTLNSANNYRKVLTKYARATLETVSAHSYNLNCPNLSA